MDENADLRDKLMKSLEHDATHSPSDMYRVSMLGAAGISNSPAQGVESVASYADPRPGFGPMVEPLSAVRSNCLDRAQEVMHRMQGAPTNAVDYSKKLVEIARVFEVYFSETRIT